MGINVLPQHAFYSSLKSEKNELLYTQNREPIVSNEALASLTLFVASSKPDEMETVKKLIISVLNRNQ